MAIQAVLFDLDGTLLPMDQEVFVRAYFGAIAKRLAPVGYEPSMLIETIYKGTGAMVKNDGTKTNEDAFWDTFCSVYGEEARGDTPHFDAFYRENFATVQSSCGYTPAAKETVLRVKERGFRVALATNPIFPAVATEARVRWAGLSPSNFELYTTYENSRFCKPSLNYYREVLETLGLRAEDCLMVGNDVGEDMIAADLGMRVFLLTNCLINRKGADISRYPHGGFDELLRCIDEL